MNLKNINHRSKEMMINFVSVDQKLRSLKHCKKLTYLVCYKLAADDKWSYINWVDRSTDEKRSRTK